jgi:hypothetical protein
LVPDRRRLKRADSALTEAASGRTGVCEKAVVPLRIAKYASLPLSDIPRAALGA